MGGSAAPRHTPTFAGPRTSALAFGSAAVSVFWTAGGTLLLDTVGGEIEDLARDRSAVAIAVGIAVVLSRRPPACPRSR